MIILAEGLRQKNKATDAWRRLEIELRCFLRANDPLYPLICSAAEEWIKSELLLNEKLEFRVIVNDDLDTVLREVLSHE